MSNKKITDLAEYTSSQVKSYDLLFITDIDNQETKKIKALELGNYIHTISGSKYRTGSFTGSFIGIASTASHLLYPNNSTASRAITASYIKNAVSSSYSDTASYALVTGQNIQLTAFEESITQTGHGLIVGDAVYKSGSGFYTASAYTGSEWAYTTEVAGIIKNVIDTNTFTICYGGIVNFNDSVPTYFNNVFNGTALFLTGSNGKLINYDPSLSDATQISKPVMLKLDNSRGLLFNQRGVYEDDAEQYTIESASYAFNSTTASYALTAAFALNGGNSTPGTEGSNNTYYIDNNPIGSIVAMAVTNTPRNYLLCDGAYVRVQDYKKLADTIYQSPTSNSSFGKWYIYNPSTNTYTPTTNVASINTNLYFKLPDFRGVFIRGLNTSNISPYDTNRVFGSLQLDAFRNHRHSFRVNNDDDDSSNQGFNAPDDSKNSGGQFGYTDPTGSNETRPVNIALNYYVKYDNDSYSLPITDNIGISGDVNGSLLSSKVTKLQGIPVSTKTPPSASALVYDGQEWAPFNMNGGFVKAWVNFNTVDSTTIKPPVIRSSYNIVSITKDDNTTNQYYTITFPAGLFSNANYVMISTAGYGNTTGGINPALIVVPRASTTVLNQYHNKTSTSITIVISDNSSDQIVRPSYDCNLVFFGF